MLNVGWNRKISRSMSEHLSHSPEETALFAEHLGSELPPNTVLTFFGNLGAGKTTFIKGLVKGAIQLPPSIVQSPTFTYLNVYRNEKTVYHFDLYRLRDSDEFLSMGFDEYFEADGICCIEWSERITPILPPSCIKVIMEHQDSPDTRKITIIGWK